MNKSITYCKRKGRTNLGAARLKSIFNDLEYDKNYEIKVGEFKDSKTNRQIRGFHGPMLEAMSETTGYHKPEAKFILKDMFGEKRMVENKFTGETKAEVLSLAKYKKEQMTGFISKCLMWMETELGIVVDMEEKKRYALDKLTGELEEIT